MEPDDRNDVSASKLAERARARLAFTVVGAVRAD
jgi:hypothetical protein